jgi:hypothetical protein
MKKLSLFAFFCSSFYKSYMKMGDNGPGGIEDATHNTVA